MWGHSAEDMNAKSACVSLWPLIWIGNAGICSSSSAALICVVHHDVDDAAVTTGMFHSHRLRHPEATTQELIYVNSENS